MFNLRSGGILGRWMLEGGQEVGKRQATSSKSWLLSNKAFHKQRDTDSIRLMLLRNHGGFYGYFWNQDFE